MVPAQPVVVGERVEHGESGFRPVHHRDRDGLVERDHRVRRDPLEQLVQHHDLVPVRLFGARRFVVHRGDRGLDLVRTDRARDERRADQLDALVDRRPVPPRRGPARRAAPTRRRHESRAARRASVSSISASSPATSPSSGSRACTRACQTDRFARSSARCRSGPDVVVYPSLKIRYSTCNTTLQPLGALGLGRQLERAPRRLDPLLGAADALRHRRLRHEERAAICAVVSPPTARNVSASCDAGESAGWQHRNSSVSVSSRSATSLRPPAAPPRIASVVDAAAVRPRAAPARSRCATRLSAAAPPTVISQARGCPARPAPATALPPRAVPLAPRPHTRRTGRTGARAHRGPAAPARAAVLDARVGVHISSPPAFITGRTSIAV